MINYWEDDFYEPSLVDEILDEFSKKLFTAANDKVIEKFEKRENEIEKANKRIEELNEIYNTLRAENKELEKTIKTQEQIEKELYLVALEKFKEENEINYKIGKNLWYAKEKYDKKIDCPVCGGKGEISVTGENGKEFNISCPEFQCCCGKKTVSSGFYPFEVTIGRITMDIGATSTSLKFSMSHKDDYFTKYELTEKFFDTKKECQAECDRLNKLEKEKNE
jgi:hypothetical protein